MREEFSEYAEILSQIFLFRGVSVAEIDSATPFLHTCAVLHYPSFQVIQNARKPIDGIAVLNKGEAAVLSDSSDKAVPLRSIGQGGVFGAASLYSGECRYETVVRALSDCEVLLLPTDAVKDLLSAHYILAENYIRFLSDRICFLNRKLTAFTADSAEAKLAVYLSELDDGKGATFTLPISLSDLADTLGIGRASLYRALAKFEEDDVIVHSGKKIRILDREALVSVFRKTE